MLNYITINTAIEIVCFIFSLICLINDSSWVWKSMILYLFVTCVVETLGIIIPGPKNLISNHWLYNIFLLFEIGFTNLMFSYLLGQYTNSKPIIVIGLIISTSVYIYEIVQHSFFTYNYHTYTTTSVLFVFYSFYYYYLLLKDERYVRLKYSAEFWWVTGTLFFYFADTASNIFYNELRKVVLWNGYHLTFYIFRVLNIILYGCWSYSFICRKWLTPTSKSLS